MKKCFSLAKKGTGRVEPNPYVGAVVYDEASDKIVSVGYHKKYGSNHAEVNAIEGALGDTKNKTLIVNLEPCSHFGKTPPCADLIIKSGFKKVVVGILDPNPLVSGCGIKKLQKAGIEVILGVLEEEARELNKKFIKNIIYKKPYVMLKTATTLDSKIALQNKKSKWITGDIARLEVQKLRSQFDAIMSGSGTILADNPRLSVRIKNKKSPKRIVFDPSNKIPLDYNVFNCDVEVILVNNSKLDLKKYPRVKQLKFENFDKLFKDLFELKIYSIMVEAGCGLNTELLRTREVDEINQFIAPKIFGSGMDFVSGLEFSEIEEAITLDKIKIKKIGNDFLINGKIKYNK